MIPFHHLHVGLRNETDQKDLSCLKVKMQRTEYREQNELSSNEVVFFCLFFIFSCQLRLKGIFYLGLWQSQ